MKPSAIDWYYKYIGGLITKPTKEEKWGYLNALFIEGLIDEETWRKELEAIKEKKDAPGKSK